jgi:hypothetical protein
MVTAALKVSPTRGEGEPGVRSDCHILLLLLLAFALGAAELSFWLGSETPQACSAAATSGGTAALCLLLCLCRRSCLLLLLLLLLLLCTCPAAAAADGGSMQ